MTHFAMSELGGEYARIFGGDPEAARSSRLRLCKVCGGWHDPSAWPHNCLPERPPRAPLAAPMLAPKFEPFVAGDHDNPVVINDRRDKRAYMDAYDLVEYDSGVRREPEPSERSWTEEFVADFKRVMETDPLNRPPTEVIGRADLDGAPEIDVTSIEIAK